MKKLLIILILFGAIQSDWHAADGGQWKKYNLKNAPFPHKSRNAGYTYDYDEKFFSAEDHYSDSSVVVFIPNGDQSNKNGQNLIIHFHGWYNTNEQLMEDFDIRDQLVSSGKNAILVFPQGPFRAADSGVGKLGDKGGLKKMIEELLDLLLRDGRIKNDKISSIILSAHSGGDQAVFMSLKTGGINDKIKSVFLFDAFFSNYENLIPWLSASEGNVLRSIYTKYLLQEHLDFMELLEKENILFSESFDSAQRVSLEFTKACHDCVIESNFREWIEVSDLENK
jgi:hypothetical protein